MPVSRLNCLVTEAHVCEQLAQSRYFYALYSKLICIIYQAYYHHVIMPVVHKALKLRKTLSQLLHFINFITRIKNLIVIHVVYS